MAQDIEKVIDLLNDMQRRNATNADSFDRLLTSIGSRLDMADKNTNTELLKTYINELAKSVDNQYSNTLNRFEDIEKAIKAVYDAQNETVRNSDMKELFDVFSKNVNNFYTEARQEKAILAGIETKIGDIASNKTDKEDIIRTISLLRNDLGNVNLSYKNTIDDINTTLKSVLAGIKSVDPLKTGDTTKAQVDVIYKAVNDIINNLQVIEENEEKLEKILDNVATNEDLKITKGIIDSILEKTDEIDRKLDLNVQKEDFDVVQQALELLNQKSESNLTEEDFLHIQKQTEDILSQTDEIKQALGQVAQDIENIPNTIELEKRFKELYGQLEELNNSVDAVGSDEDITDISLKFKAFEDELEIIQNIITDMNEALSSKVLNAIEEMTNSESELSQIVSDMFKQIPKKDDIEDILNHNEILDKLFSKSTDISENLESLPIIKDETEEIHKKTSSIENWLISSNIKENSEKIATQIEHTSTSDEVAQIQYTTNEIISVLEKLSKTYDVEQISESMAQIREQLNVVSSALEKTYDDAGDGDIYEKLSDLERSMSQIVSKGEFEDFIEELKSCIANLSSNTGTCGENIEQMRQIQQDIEARLSELDFSKTTEALEGKFEDLNDSINSIKDFVKNNSGADIEYIKSELDEIKSLVTANASDFDNAGEFNNPDIDSVKKYLSDIKDMLQDHPKSGLYSKILSIEDSIVNNQTFNENAFSQIIEKIGNIKYGSKTSEADGQMEQSLSEISSLKDRVETLSRNFEGCEIDDIENPEKNYISKIEEFIGEKLTEISKELEDITKTSDKKIADGFTYQAELLEQKTTELQKLISDINLNSGVKDTKFGKKLSDTNETLGDFKQELQLVSTDITENISQNAEKILSELAPIREIIEKMNANSNPQTLKNEVKELNKSLVEAPELADLSADFEDLYDKLTEKFAENENNLKDFILTDTDSIIIKLDNLRDYVEQSLDAIVPPDAGDMAELQTFISEIKDFRENQAQLLDKSVDEIKKEIKQQSDEIKSMLTVANNHEEIISAIEELKKSFKSKTGKKSKSADTEEEITTYSQDAVEDLKSDFEKYSKKIAQLSDDNSRITGILESISQRLENVSVSKTDAKVTEGDEIDDDFEVSEEDIFGSDKFDFVQAFDILQNDIKNLTARIEEVKNNSDNKVASKIPSINNSGVIMNINTKVDDILKSLNNDWASDIEKYIKTENLSLNAKLDSIESKLDIFVADTTNSDILNEVSETLGDINDSVADIAPKIEETIVPKIEALTPAIEEKLSENDKRLSTMLEELNQKIAQIGSDDNSIEELNNIKTLIGEQKTYIEDLEPSEKLEAFKKCLDEISFEVNALASDSNADSEKLNATIKEMKEALMNAVLTIFDQVSFVEESEDIKDFVEERTDEINKNIAQITKQLHQMTSSDESINYNYSMQDIETDLAKLRLALQDSQQIDLSEITDKLHSITSSVDSLTQDEIKELKSEISNLREQTQFLIATSDKSYNALNDGIEGFGEIINDNITGKVDNLSKMLETSAQSDKVIRQALIYIGEWIDSATSSINKISSNSDEISRINEVITGIDDLKTVVNTQINEAIEEKFGLWNSQIKSLEKQFAKVENLELQIAGQQERIDRLEMNIDKLLSIVENLDDPGMSRKMDKIEKQLSKLGTNVEKLVSYVD